MKHSVGRAKSLIQGGFTLLLAALMSACGAAHECPVAPDQKGSFMAKAIEFPLKVRGDTSWSEAEREALQRAVIDWNEPAQHWMGESAFDLSFTDVQDLDSSNSALQGCELPEGSASTFSIYRVTESIQWKTMGFAISTPAVTLRCHRGDRVVKQAVLVNPALIHQQQMRSVFLHELGHSVGLDHSCQLDRASGTFRGCAGLVSDHPYVKAVMYPTLRIRSPSYSPSIAASASVLEIKEALAPNDLTRAGCVFRH
jgi:hypothetical protein